MIGSLHKRDITLFGLLVAFSLAIGVAGWFVSEEFQEQMLQETAEDEALHMGFFVMERLSDPSATFAYGAITEQDQDLINIVAETGNVYRYSFFNADGIIVVASRPGDLGRRKTESFFFDVVRQGQTHVEFDRNVEFHPDDIVVERGTMREGRFGFSSGADGRQSRAYVAEVYVPVIQDGAFLGAVEVYVDASGLSEYLSTEIQEARFGAGGMMLLLVVVISLVVYRNINDRNRQLATVQAASQSLALAEEEVLRLNADLEKRVDERTSELAKANEAVTKLNEDLERRVEERTEQISKANDQLYRLNESMTRLNESLEQRVEERTSALNKANADVLKLNEELEHRVEERTSELHAAQADLLRNERLAALGQLTATVSHELRNPLGAIRTAVYLVAGRTKDAGLGVEGALERADRSITRCDNIITELLDFTRTTDLALEEVPFDEWLSSVLDEQTVPKGIAFENQVSTEGLEIAFDQDRFRRVIINVFNNGCEAMLEEAQGGSDKQHQMTVSSTLSEDRLEVRFVDNGPGIPPEILEKIFEPLYSTKSFGVGLGLPTVRQIMRQHGGDIEMHSTPGQGTTVLLWLPRNLAERGAVDYMEAAAQGDHAPQPILAAEPIAAADMPAAEPAPTADPMDPAERMPAQQAAAQAQPMPAAEPMPAQQAAAPAEPIVAAEPMPDKQAATPAEPIVAAEPVPAADMPAAAPAPKIELTPATPKPAARLEMAPPPPRPAPDAASMSPPAPASESPPVGTAAAGTPAAPKPDPMAASAPTAPAPGAPAEPNPLASAGVPDEDTSAAPADKTAGPGSKDAAA